MRRLLALTARPWPVPGCRCAVCQYARGKSPAIKSARMSYRAPMSGLLMLGE